MVLARDRSDDRLGLQVLIMHQSKIRELKKARHAWRRQAVKWADRVERMTGPVKAHCQKQLQECKDQLERINRELGRHA